MKKLPSGVSNYEELIMDDYYYVDKTEYIKKLEDYPNKKVMFLRPRKFGKTLFTSTLENYYDIKTVDKFDALFSETYIGQNPTKLKNSYHILKFNFSGIDTSSAESTILSFKKKIALSINVFVNKYNLDFYVNETNEAEDILNNLFKAFLIQKSGEKIYVIIDEYDHFANELLGFNVSGFKDLVSKNGKVRKWYEILKEGTESVVDRIFITGVAPITLDSLTSGFNILDDITRDFEFNQMMGFTKEELTKLMINQNISSEEIVKLLPLIKENYDGYKFSTKADEKLYNSNMCLYFLKEYTRQKEMPERMVDVNIASDYSKIGKMLNLCKGEKRLEILEKSISGEGILSVITDKFNPQKDFGDNEMVSMLFYLGYLTIDSLEFGAAKLIIPNKTMKEIYADFFLKTMTEESGFEPDISYLELTKEVAQTGNIDKVAKILEGYLKELSNRDYQRFDEKYVKAMFYTIVKNLNSAYNVKSEPEVERKYPDLLLISKDEKYYSILIEFKYLKKAEAKQLSQKRKDAKMQIEEYANFEEIKDIPNLRKYTIVAVNDKLYIDEI